MGAQHEHPVSGRNADLRVPCWRDVTGGTLPKPDRNPPGLSQEGG